MAYRADITQQLTPSTPDVSGAVRAIQAQAGIADTLFKGISTGLGMYKQQMGEELLGRAQDLQKEEVTKDQARIVAANQASIDLQKAQAALETNRLAESADVVGNPTFTGPAFAKEGAALRVSAEPAFKANVEAAASRLALVQANGGITPSEYFLRVSKLVDEYSAKYPGSRNEIRKIVEQGSGLPGADLWAQQQFINRLYAPQKNTAQAQEEAQSAERKFIFEMTGNSPTDILAEQQRNSPTYLAWKDQATQLSRSQAASSALRKQLDSQTTEADVNFTQVSDTARRLALANSGKAVLKYTGSLGAKFNDLGTRLANNAFTQNDVDEATGYISNMKNIVNKEFSSAILEIMGLPTGAGVSQTAKDNAIKNIKETQAALLASHDTSDVSLIKNIMQIYTSSSKESLDNKVKYITGMTTYLKMFGKDDVIAGLMSVPEFDENNVQHPRWKAIEATDPGLAEGVRQIKQEIGATPIQMASTLVKASNLGQTMRDATTTPGPTPIDPSLPAAQNKTNVSAVNEAATNRMNSLRAAAGAVQQTWQGSQMQQRQASGIAEAFVADMKDLNLCSTAMCNAANGYALQKIASNKAGWKDLYSKIPQEQKAATQQAVSIEVENSLESARKDLVEINKKNGTNLQFGVDPASKTYGLVPPSADKFYDPTKLNPGQINQPISAQMRIGVDIPEPFKKYYPKGMLVKPEFVQEITKLGEAAKEWNNRNLPKVAGSFIAQASVTGEDEFAIAQNFMRSVDYGKPITGFYSIPTPQPEQRTSTGGGVVAAATSFQPQAGDSERVTIVKREIAAVEKNTQLAKKRLERAKAANDAEDVSVYENELKRTASDVEALQDELRRLQKGR